MIVDTSAIVAMARDESAAADVVRALSADHAPSIGAPTATECLLVLTARLGPSGRTVFERLRSQFGIEVIDYTEEHAVEALHAFTRYGKGRHSAALNFGDCMSYASARVSRQPLLAVGDDFPQTDLLFNGGIVGRWAGTE